MGVELRRTVICRLAVAAETASDSIVFGEQAVLFAHREGRVIEYLPGEFPSLIVVGFISPNDKPVDTLTYVPAHYDRSEIESFRVLRGLARKAILEQNVVLLGHVATASARINQRYLPKRHFEELLQIAAYCDALGVQVAHSGNLMGLLLDASDPNVTERSLPRLKSCRAGIYEHSSVRGERRCAAAPGGVMNLTSFLHGYETPQIIELSPNFYAAQFRLMKLLPAHYILDRAEENKLIKAGGDIVETSSGTFALALAMLSAVRGYHLTIVSSTSLMDRGFKTRLEQLGTAVRLVEDPGNRQPGGSSFRTTPCA